MKEPKNIVAVDPSYRGLGLVVYKSGQAKPLYLMKYVSQAKDIQSFGGAVQATSLLMRDVKQDLVSVLGPGHRETVFIIESPPSSKAFFSSGLFLLSGALSCMANQLGAEVFCCSCQLTKSVMGSRKTTKKQTVEYPKRFLNVNRIESNVSLVKDHNVCDALIILAAFTYINGFPVFNRFQTLSKARFQKINFKYEKDKKKTSK